MKSKVVTREDIISLFKDGQIIAIGGQANHGSPTRLIECLVESGAKHLTVISIDSGDMNLTIGRLIHEGRVDKLITTHIGKNPETVSLYDAGKIEVELNPMGSFIERVRCGGMGLGGVLTKTGLGTVVQETRESVWVNGEEYLIEPALRADISLTRARKADPIGNLVYHGTGENSNPIIATAGDLSIVEADRMFDLGELSMDEIKLPSVFIDLILP
ncbi:MAG: CoA transferase subunit A [Agathobacter sp.]